MASGLRWIKEHFGSDIWVLVHDAARPLVRVDDIERLMQSVEVESAIGGLLGVPAVDTLKQVGTGNLVGRTIDRELVWMAMTPQMFQAGPLLDAIDAAMSEKLPLTDESSAMELADFQPLMVECHRDNIKITHPQDIALSEHLMDTANKKTTSTMPVSSADDTPS